MDPRTILFYEELQSNAFPALQTVMYDGWSVRFGGGFTYRVNDANPMYPEHLPVEEKIGYVEALYRASSLDKSIFKLHEGMDPERLAACDRLLEANGYVKERHGNIFVCDLTSFSRPSSEDVTLESHLTEDWLDRFLTMNGTEGATKDAAKSMLRSIVFPLTAASIWEDGRMIACGLGVMERGRIGLYDIFVDASCRRRGLGVNICAAIMNEGKAAGCTEAYLQCLTNNHGARRLYALLGYKETYAYWFRIKRFT